MAAARTRLPDILAVGQEDWDDVERRNQLLLRALAERHPRTRFLFSELPRRPREARTWRWPRVRRVAENIWVVRPIRPLPDSVSACAADALEALQLRRAAQQVALECPMLWTQDPRALDLVDRLPVDGILYDLTDDWAAFETDPDRRVEVQRRIEELGRRSELVLACSRTLEEGAKAWTDRVAYLPNAVNPAPAEGVPCDLEALPRPRLGYVGTLHAARVDIELVRRAAELRSEWSFVFVGPDLLDQAARERLLEPSNVHHIGVRPHRRIPSYLAGFDVCLLPNLVNDFTRSLDPLKIYEYLAAGRPVVSTAVDNVPDLEEHLEIAETAAALVSAAERVMENDDEVAQARRRAAVVRDTWEERAVTVESLLGIAQSTRPAADVSVVVVSFNTRELTRRCLEHLALQEQPRLQTIVVDNGSTDGSVEMIRERFPEVELVELDENIGFGPANNVGFERCRGRYVLLLNSDAFLAKNALSELVAALTRHAAAGAVGARLLNPDGSLQRSAWPFPTPWRAMLEALLLHRPLRRLGLIEDLGTWAHDYERPVDYVIGACVLLRREALAEIGGFDEAFWLYAEETDLEKRLAARGWSVIFTPAAVATHVGSASSRESEQRLRRFYSGQLRYMRKHHGRGGMVVTWLSLMVGAAVRFQGERLRAALEARPRQGDFT
jgi:GT2 family glycosyltransferase/glycosyltransferase involved in cell wall biosynthesis